MTAPTVDKTDRKILHVLQRDARISNQRLADEVGLSVSPCWRRVKKLEQEGYIDRYVTLLDAGKVGLRITAFVHVSLEDHHPDTLKEFDQLIRTRPEVLECFAMSGQDDYLLRVVCPDMDAYEAFLTRHLLALKGVRTANTSFVLKTRKSTTALPLR